MSLVPVWLSFVQGLLGDPTVWRVSTYDNRRDKLESEIYIFKSAPWTDCDSAQGLIGSSSREGDVVVPVECE